MKNFLQKTALAAAVSITPTFALGLELSCTMTDYGIGSLHKGLQQLVPAKSVHQLTDSSARTKGMRGSVEQLGSKLKIRYFGTLQGVGETEVTYSYSRSSGAMVARTRGLKSFQWDQEYPERTGKYVITGSCTER